MTKTFKLFRIFLGLILVKFLLVLGLIIFQNTSQRQAHYKAKLQIVQRFLLSDYCLSTESRHTRHIALPEILAPFQDLPGYHEHFPSSSFIWYQKDKR